MEARGKAYTLQTSPSQILEFKVTFNYLSFLKSTPQINPHSTKPTAQPHHHYSAFTPPPPPAAPPPPPPSPPARSSSAYPKHVVTVAGKSRHSTAPL
jgi:hypothetical protein